jgi:hypothetical protein
MLKLQSRAPARARKSMSERKEYKEKTTQTTLRKTNTARFSGASNDINTMACVRGVGVSFN